MVVCQNCNHKARPSGKQHSPKQHSYLSMTESTLPCPATTVISGQPLPVLGNIQSLFREGSVWLFQCRSRNLCLLRHCGHINITCVVWCCMACGWDCCVPVLVSIRGKHSHVILFFSFFVRIFACRVLVKGEIWYQNA